MRIGEYRVCQIRLRRRADTFTCRPAVVCAGDAFVDFFPGGLSNIVDEESAGSGLEIKRKRIAETESPDCTILSACLREKRIICGRCSIGIDAKHFSEDGPQGLGVRGIGIFSDTDIELTVFSKVDPSAVVIGG